RARHNHHARRRKTATGQGCTHIAEAVHLIGQSLNLVPADIQLIFDVQHPGGRDHQMGFHIRTGLQHLQQAHGVDRPGGPGHTYDQASLGAHSRAPASRSMVSSSPFSYISDTMSEPPTNSPLMYSWGMVGQLEKSLMP